MPSVSMVEETEHADRTMCRSCGKHFWFNDGLDPEIYPDEIPKPIERFGSVAEFALIHDFVCSHCNRILLKGRELEYIWPYDANYIRWDRIAKFGQAMIVCECGARQLMKIPSELAKAVRKDGEEEKRGS